MNDVSSSRSSTSISSRDLNPPKGRRVIARAIRELLQINSRDEREIEPLRKARSALVVSHRAVASRTGRADHLWHTTLRSRAARYPGESPASVNNE